MFARGPDHLCEKRCGVNWYGRWEDSQGGPFYVWTSNFLACYLSPIVASEPLLTWKKYYLNNTLLKHINACCISTQNSVTVVFQNIYWDQRQSASAVFALAEKFSSRRILALFTALVMTPNFTRCEFYMNDYFYSSLGIFNKLWSLKFRAEEGGYVLWAVL